MTDDPAPIDKRAPAVQSLLQQMRGGIGEIMLGVESFRDSHGESQEFKSLWGWIVGVEARITQALGECPDEDPPEIQKIKGWPYQDGFADLLAFARGYWHLPEWGWEQEGKEYSISTGGWSDNEEIMAALRSNMMFWMMCWKSSRRGGHFEFEIPEKVK